MAMKIRLGFIGAGTVGSGALLLLQKNRAFFLKELGIDFDVRMVASRQGDTLPESIPASTRRTHDAMEVCRDPEVDVVLELAGGYELPRQWQTEALQNGKHVVTANKALLAKHGAELFPLAAEKGCHLMYEAAVGGGIPIIKALQESFIANDIQGLACIINGTCNYILTNMTQKKLGFAEVLQDAQKLGYAEADPTFDIEGVDSAHKVALLASLCYGKFVDFQKMSVEGITRVSALDIQMADELGFVIKLLGTVSQDSDGNIQASVYPALLEKDHQLATVNGVLNAVYLKTSAVGPVLLTGAGAGQLPTASAVVSDLVTLAGRLADATPSPNPMHFFRKENEAELVPIDALETEFYLRLTTEDKPGVLARVTAILAEEGISIRSILQKAEHDPENVPVILLTHLCRDAQIQKALKRINALDTIRGASQLIRFYK